MMYHVRVSLATSWRIFQQLLHDPRTIVLMMLAPVVLMSLLYWVFVDTPQIFNSIAPALLGVFPFVIMFLITSITTLRERTVGTMERLMVTPIGKFDIILGYALAFGLLGVLQSLITSTLVIYWLGMDVMGPQWFVILVGAVDTVLGVALGLFVSAFARTEFQAIQFMPAFVFPQILICGLFVPLASMPDVLERVAYVFPLTYAVDALNLVTTNPDVTGVMWQRLLAVGAFILGALVLASLTLRRRTS